MLRFVYGFVLCALAVSPLITQASPVIRTGDTVTIGAAEVVNGDWYAAGGTVTASGAVKGDAYLAGGTVTMNAPIAEDAVILGGTVRIHAAVGGDVRIAAGDTTIAGTVGGDVIVLGGNLHIMNTAVITGDVLLYGGTVSIEGAIRGSLFGSADALRLDGTVDGPVTLTRVGDLALGSSAHVKKGVVYTAPHELTQATGARVFGDLTFNETVLPGVDVRSMLDTILMLGALAFVFHALFHKHLGGFVSRAQMRMGMTWLVGAGVMIATPILAAVALATGLGIYVGIALGALYILLMAMSFGFIPVLAGAYAMRLHTRTLRTNFGTTALGVALAGVVILIMPVVLLPFLIAYTAGALTLEIYAELFGKVKGRA